MSHESDYTDELVKQLMSMNGKYKHYCPDWDFFPIDETCLEWPCACAAELIEREKQERAEALESFWKGNE